MKSILSVLLGVLSLAGMSQGQISQTPLGLPDGNENTFVMPIRPSMSDLIRQDRVMQNPLGKIEPAGNRWYIFERMNDQRYWENVNLSELILELEKGYTLDDPALKPVLAEMGLDSLRGKSHYPDMQNFFTFHNPSPDKETVLKIGKALRSIAFVKFIEPSPIIEMQGCVPNDPYYAGYQWGPYVIRADSVWCYFTGGSHQLVGVIDDAFDYSHPDLQNVIRYGYDFTNSDNDPSPDFASDQHGTHVAGTIGASIHNGIGVAGIINDTMYVAKVADNIPNNSSFDGTAILNAINAIATLTRIRTYNMSFGSPSPSSAQENAINNTWSNGKLPIAAAGNDATSSPFYPAAYTNVVSVSAVGVTSNGYLTDASYSNYGNWINVSAPGGETSTGYPIRSTIPGNSYGDMQGTSMASPHVTGVAALIFAMNPLLSNAQARTILQSKVFDLGTPGYDQLFGNGMVCAFCAYEEACNQFNISITSGSTSICSGSTVTLNAPSHIDIQYQWRRNGTDIPNATSSQYAASQSGTYTLYATTAGGCISTSNTITLTVTPAPVAAFTYSAVGNSVSFTSNSSNGTSYSWNFGNGSTSTQQNPGHTYSSPGVYTVTLTVTNACGSNTTTQQITVGSTSVENYTEDISFGVFPNPAYDITHISCVLDAPHDVAVSIFDLSGKMISAWRSEQAMSGVVNIPLDISAYSSGVYFIQLQIDGANTMKRKLIKL